MGANCDSIYQKEQIKAHGETVFLKLAPVDPRSLIQGDYMQLRYAIERDGFKRSEAARGYIVLSIDQKGIGSFKRFFEGEALAPNEKLMRYHKEYSGIRIVPYSFMFQEGHAKFYAKAAYGIFKFDSSSNHILVGLADDQLREIKPADTTEGT